jgi:hypothetical protein
MLGKHLLTSEVREMLHGRSCRVDDHALQDLAKESQMMTNKNKATNPGQVEERQQVGSWQLTAWMTSLTKIAVNEVGGGQTGRQKAWKIW